MKIKLKKIFGNLERKKVNKTPEEAEAIKELAPKKQTDFTAGSPGGGGVDPL